MIRPPEPTTSHGQNPAKRSGNSRLLAAGPVAIALAITASVAMYTWVTQWNTMDLQPARISVNLMPPGAYDPSIEHLQGEDPLMLALPLGQSANDLMMTLPGDQPLLSEPAHLPAFDDVGQRLVGISRRVDRVIEETAIWSFNEPASVMAHQYHQAALARGFELLNAQQRDHAAAGTLNRVYVRMDQDSGLAPRVLVVRVRPVDEQTSRATLWFRFDPNG